MNFTEEARKIYADINFGTEMFAAALQSVYERGREKERERCLKIVDAHCPVAQDMQYAPNQSLCKNIENIIRSGKP